MAFQCNYLKFDDSSYTFILMSTNVLCCISVIKYDPAVRDTQKMYHDMY